MKTTKLVTALIAATAAMSVYTGASATEPSAYASGNAALNNSIKGNFSVGSNGSSTSYAHNSESATASVSATAAHKHGYKHVDAGASGSTKTESFGKAYNASTGSGNGWAASSGHADASTDGSFQIHGITSGFNGGHASTQTDNKIIAGKNQGSYVAGETKSGFDAEVNYTKHKSYAPAPAGWNGGTSSSTVSIHDTKTGYASGANSTGTLEGLNAAGIANIGASGHFFAKVKASGETGTVSAP